MGREQLRAKIDQLGDPEAVVVERVVDAELIEIESTVLLGSWLASPAWAEGFSARLRAHHALNPEPLATSAFEAAFNGASDVAGYSVLPATSATHRFFDTTVTTSDGRVRRISLKSTSAKDLKPKRVHISKLTEAAWIQDARLQRDRRASLVALFGAYREATDAILQIRAFRTHEGFRYQLVEIDTSMFQVVEDLTVADAQKGTISFPTGTTWRNRTFAVTIDGSDAKITLTGVDIEQCTIHGEWVVPNLSGVEAPLPEDAEDGA